MSLYEEIGGKPAVDAAVDIFYAKILADDSINHFFTGMDMRQQRMKMKLFLYYALGGEKQYNGKDLRSSHKDLKLTGEHFDNVGMHLKATLEELSVAPSIIDQLLAVVKSTRDDILNRPPSRKIA